MHLREFGGGNEGEWGGRRSVSRSRAPPNRPRALVEPERLRGPRLFGLGCLGARPGSVPPPGFWGGESQVGSGDPC